MSTTAISTAIGIYQSFGARLHSEPAQRIIAPGSFGNKAGARSGLGQETDRLSLSREGQELAARQRGGNNTKTGSSTNTAPLENNKETATRQDELQAEEQQALQELKARDREVRAHEQAHLAAAGQYAKGGPSYTYQRGPDGRQYAIGGEVSIDTSAEKDPAQTIAKMRTVAAAAMAPANPSSTDRQVAAMAAGKEAQARMELQKQAQEKGGEATMQGSGTEEETKATAPSIDLSA